MEQELWKPVVGYEGLYEVSNLGRIKSLDRIVTNSNGVKITKKGRLLKLQKSIHGYLYVALSKSGKSKPISVHRYVAEAFLERKEGKAFVDHIDTDKTNNRASNLRWCTYLENFHNVITEEKWREAIKNRNSTNAKRSKVYQFSMEGKLLNCFHSITEAKKQTGVTSIGYALMEKKNHNRYAGGYLWSRTELLECSYIPCKNDAKIICQYDLEGNLLAEYDNLLSASMATGIKKCTIWAQIKFKRKSRFPYIFKYKGEYYKISKNREL